MDRGYSWWTEYYRRTDRPPQVDIRCPRCAACAVFDTPFEFYLPNDILPEAEVRPTHQWGQRLVIEKYPSVLKWLPPYEKWYEGWPKTGVVKCTNCHLVAAHELTWPDEAYYQWDIRGYRLWAWSQKHARILLAFLGNMERDPERFPGYQLMLRKLPKEVTSAKVRDLIVKEISRTLENG
jgi:hypothetical protein